MEYVSEPNEFILARNSQLAFYREVPLFTKAGNRFTLYKPGGVTLAEMRLSEGRHPKALYIRASERLKGLQEAQKAFNRQLSAKIGSGDIDGVRDTLVTIVAETLTEPRSGSLEGVSDTVGILVGDYSIEKQVIKQLLNISRRDYTTVMHSINVMAFALAFAAHCDYSLEDSKTLGLCALLHDVGKTKIDQELLIAPRKLKDEEFEQVKRHTVIGFDILRSCKFPSKEISICALDHHEKLDGSGYPNGKTNLSTSAQIIGMIDCYEALTNDQRPYRNAVSAFDALGHIIKKDVDSGKFGKELYAQFVMSLGRTAS